MGMTNQVSLLVNNFNDRTKISVELIKLLESCHSFCFSVAFIKDSGLAILRPTLLKLEKNNIPGIIITSTYLDFNEPKIFKELLKFKNIKVYIYQKEGFHPKGYLFNYHYYSSIVVGSANLTQSALTVNTEWNIKTNLKQGDLALYSIENEINYQIENSIPLTHDWIENYQKRYVPKLKNIEKYQVIETKPNLMQESALKALSKLRAEGKNKALIISATGTGKTYLSAFDVKNVYPHKMLFVVHRESIARTAMETFKKVITHKKMGLFTGSHKNIEADYIFTTVQTMSKQKYLEMFSKDTFNYIIIDEVHRAGASSYQNLLNYFKPQFLLGMSATPERTDSFNVYQMFDYNIAYEIRLQQAMEYQLLCPFHYYGISDFSIEGQTINDKSQFNMLVSNTRVDYVIENIQKYSYSGNRVKGLVFCSRKDEAKELSRLFNLRGFKTCALVGEDSEDKRIQAMNLLESNDENNYLDYIFTVDIFNEGIDIPSVNQVVMLRPTQSHIIFIQQLGRGLRKHQDKDYVVVIDFIGNYANNFQIPIALSGNVSYNKDHLRYFILEGASLLPGESTISFDEISQKRIFETIDQANFNQIKIIRDSYFNLKYKLGRIPSLMDFEYYDSIDPLKIIKNQSIKSYHNFLKKNDKEDYHISFNQLEEKYLEYISMKFADGKRVHELEAIKLCIEKNTQLMKSLNSVLEDKYKRSLNKLSYTTIVNELTQNFATGTGKETYKEAVFLENDQDICVSSQFKQLITNNIQFRQQILDIIEFGLYRNQKEYKDSYQDTDLCLYQKYTYEDVCRLLNWEVSVVAQNIGGYKYDQRTNTLPVFINYDKAKGIDDNINYHDRFINPNTLICMSKSGEGINSKRVSYFKNSKQDGTTIHVFVRKNKDDKNSKEFYYLGTSKINKVTQTVMPKTNKVICEIEHILDVPVRQELYDYIVNN